MLVQGFVFVFPEEQRHSTKEPDDHFKNESSEEKRTKHPEKMSQVKSELAYFITHFQQDKIS